MDSEIIKKYSKLDSFNVSRETCYEFESLINMILKKKQSNKHNKQENCQ